jgi:hypothetical protein
METGDTEFAFFSLAYFNIHAYMMGLPLGSIIEESQSLIDQMDQYSNASVRAIVLPFHQMLLELSGRTEDPLAWVHATEGGNNARRRQKKSHDPSETVKLIWSNFSRGQLAYYLGETESADQIWTRLKPLLAGLASYSAPTLDLYFTGLIATAMFRKTRARKHKGKAQKAIRSMKSLMEKFNNTGLNNLHRYYIMKADYSATFESNKTREEVRKEFDQAISAATKAGFMQDAALAHELVGEFFVTREDIFWAKHYLTSAHSLYRAWGAQAKADQLFQKRGSFVVPRKQEIQNSLSRRGPLSSQKYFDALTVTIDTETASLTSWDKSSAQLIH